MGTKVSFHSLVTVKDPQSLLCTTSCDTTSGQATRVPLDCVIAEVRAGVRAGLGRLLSFSSLSKRLHYLECSVTVKQQQVFSAATTEAFYYFLPHFGF